MDNDVSQLLINYVIYKDLYESKKYNNPYKILAQFIIYSLKEHALQEVTVNDLKQILKDDYGFELPLLVIQKTLTYVNLIKKDKYIVNKEDLVIDDIIQENLKNIDDHKNLLSFLFEFAKNNFKVTEEKKQELFKAFYMYLTSDNYCSEYSEIISSFIIGFNSDYSMMKILDSIKIGALLYHGLTSQLDELGKLNNTLVLYLDTAILFSLFGLNGDNFKEITSDLLMFRSIANKKELRIILKFFKHTEQEIDAYFAQAEIVLAQNKNPNSVAMKNILSGCKTQSDVLEKHIQFKQFLNKNQIYVEQTDFYSTKFFDFNLEDQSLLDNYAEDDVKSISNICKMRKHCRKVVSYLDSGFLFVTTTQNVIQLSNEINNQGRFSIYFDSLINLLWYKLNNGFSSTNFPKNINAVIIAQNILSGIFSNNINLKLKEVNDKYHKGELSKESLIAYTCVFREKMLNPEEINSDILTDYHMLMAEEISNHKNKLITLTNENSKLKEEVNKEKKQLNDTIDENVFLKTRLSETQKENDELTHYKNIVMIGKKILYNFLFFLLCCAVCFCGYSIYMYLYNDEGVKQHIGFLSSILTIFSSAGGLYLIVKIVYFIYKKIIKING